MLVFLIWQHNGLVVSNNVSQQEGPELNPWLGPRALLGTTACDFTLRPQDEKLENGIWSNSASSDVHILKIGFSYKK